METTMMKELLSLCLWFICFGDHPYNKKMRISFGRDMKSKNILIDNELNDDKLMANLVEIGMYRI